MGRELTPQEREAYERIRRRNLEETASKLGISAEKLERIENDAARAGAEAPVHERVQAEAALRAALENWQRTLPKASRRTHTARPLKTPETSTALATTISAHFSPSV